VLDGPPGRVDHDSLGGARNGGGSEGEKEERMDVLHETFSRETFFLIGEEPVS
jgi:hypothetical protein